MTFRLAAACGLFAYASMSFATGGALDANGCHQDPTTGKPHCHRAPAEVQAGLSSAADEINLDAGTGARSASASEPNYESCRTARKAGVAPLTVGSPGYSAKLDPDGDGVACE